VPELPEVETVRRVLEKRIAGRRIVGLEVRDPRLRTPLDPAALHAALVGRSIVHVARRSKYLLLHLSGDRVLVVHLGMTGNLRVARGDDVLEPHTHVRIALGGGEELRYADPRRFGMLFEIGQAEIASHPRLGSIGPEPLEPGFDAQWLVQRAALVRKPIKNFLLDGRVVAGVGNIYACEALYRAGVHPRRAAGRLAAERWQVLCAALRTVLSLALRDGGTTLQDYRDAEGRSGAFQLRLRVYGREGHRCRRCRGTIRRIVQAGRSTFYCPGCQR